MSITGNLNIHLDDNRVNQALVTINRRYCFEEWKAEEPRKCTAIEGVEVALG
jgi:hypothetical protein